jgi:aspartyl-tRNA(Asn)/glutamyl-tRNA(Gln) amidotransferase subunit C
MSETKHIDIDYVANLARIALNDEEKKAFAGQLDNILKYIEKLESADVSGVEPTAHPFEVVNVWREDAAGESFSAETATSDAPAARENMVVVPKVVDDA